MFLQQAQQWAQAQGLLPQEQVITKRAAWLNIAEIELSVLTRQGLEHNIATVDELCKDTSPRVSLNVNPDATEVLQEPMEYMPYADIAKGSKRDVLEPLLRVLPLFKHLKLQACELLL
jgi:hypothetical protein